MSVNMRLGAVLYAVSETGNQDTRILKTP